MGRGLKTIDVIFLVYAACVVLFVSAYCGYLSYTQANGQMCITIYSDTGDVIDEFEGNIKNYKSVDGTITFEYDGRSYQYENAVVQVERNK